MQIHLAHLSCETSMSSSLEPIESVFHTSKLNQITYSSGLNRDISICVQDLFGPVLEQEPNVSAFVSMLS